MVEEEKSRKPADTEERLLDDAFVLAAIIKGVDGILELAGGIIVATIPAHTVNSIIDYLKQHVALTRSWDGLIARHLDSLNAQFQTGRPTFFLVYLFAHGFIKILIAYALLRRRYRLYPYAIVLLLGFVAYQLYEVVTAHSISLFLLSLLDIVIARLTYLEYRRHRPR